MKDCLDCRHSAKAHALIGSGTCAAGERKAGPFGLFTVRDETCECIRFRFPPRK